MPRKKDKIVKLKEGDARVKKIKNLGKNEEGKLVQTQVIKNPDKSKVVNRWVDGDLTSQDLIPKKIKPKKTKKLKKVRVPRKLKKVKVPSYTAPEVTLDEKTEQIMKIRENKKKNKKKLKIKLPKIFKKKTKRPKPKKVKNLVTGKYNILR